jgi:hypothetical protein
MYGFDGGLEGRPMYLISSVLTNDKLSKALFFVGDKQTSLIFEH